MAELEGFICPLCMQSLPGVSQLEKHVREEHSDSASGKMKANFRQFIGKAKTTLSKTKAGLESSINEGAAAVALRKSPEGEDEGEDLIINVTGINIELWPEQEFGFERSRMEMFRKVRDVKVQRIAVETNRLLIRLGKLLKILKNEHSMKHKQLKALEQDIVPWKRDSEQKRCMKCSKEFSVRRRKHHCRLCGDLICKHCSNFLPLSEAYQLVSDNPEYQSLLPSPGSRRKRGKFSKVLKDDDSDDEEDSSDELRVCPTCEELLIRRLAQMLFEGKTLITALYEKMQSTMVDADNLKPKYLEMNDSLINGEYHFRLVDAHGLRQDLVKLYEVVDSVSKQILALKYDDGREPTPTCQKVQRSVRVYASTYLQENLLTLPGLPTREKLKQIREEKEKEAEERRHAMMRHKEEQRELEAAAAAAAAKKESTKLEIPFSIDTKFRVSPTFTKKAKAVFGIKMSDIEDVDKDLTSGWTAEPAISSTLDIEVDPFELQRQQLLSYINQAEQAKRFDEVATLKESLREIESLMEQAQM